MTGVLFLPTKLPDTQISQNRAKFKCTRIILLNLHFRSNYNSRRVFFIFHDIHQDHGVSSDTERHTMFSPKFLGRSLKSWQLHSKKVSCCFVSDCWLAFDLSWLGSMVIRSPLGLRGLFEVPAKAAQSQSMCSMERGTVEHLKVHHPTLQSTYISSLSKHLLILAV